MPLPKNGAVSSLAEMCRAPPTLSVTFDLGHVLAWAWEEPREQAVSVNEGDRWTWSYREAKGQAH